MSKHMDYIILSIVIMCVLVVLITQKECFINSLSGSYIEYLKKAPGYFNLKKSSVFGDTLRIFYPKDACGKDKTETCGISAVVVYPGNLNPKIATLSADALFEPGFAFDGGKLGLGFEMGSGGATGGHANKTASSCRVIFKKDGRASCYIYVPLDSIQTDAKLINLAAGKSVYGAEFFEDIFTEGTFKVGVKNKVEIGVKMNTPGVPDGECFVSINGTVAKKTGIMWLTNNVGEGITKLNHTSFVGGANYASKDQYVQISNIKLTDAFPLYHNICSTLSDWYAMLFK